MSDHAPCGCPVAQVSDKETRIFHTIQCNDPAVIEQSIRRELERRERHERYMQADRDETEGG